MLSASPDLCLERAPAGVVRTAPIKGTRPRGRNPETDRPLAGELLASETGRAELIVVVDLEHNDLDRVAAAGGVRMRRGPHLESLPYVHHLVAEVEGRYPWPDPTGTGISPSGP
ncbi:protein of unknown function [Candidatus Hydrogenisulfobacillus filiaventi]|uniref:Chorismate-utilising enzyme C-terminal domain-containing protein n=1 Tax=Candidatus Hydrogenisulfobacillus filiaventi TaxID=2707344 RepID=A0A6F8ZGZ9_9FIRM|nr:protein of unknown function [Candidatus Hydrogenisulfobacillus filiaventi]